LGIGGGKGEGKRRRHEEEERKKGCLEGGKLLLMIPLQLRNELIFLFDLGGERLNQLVLPLQAKSRCLTDEKKE